MRKCDGCTLCCIIPAVPELGKPINEACVFCSKGCKIYPSRPRSCRAFTCAWLAGEMPRWMKPDKVHVMIEPMVGFKTVLALAEPGYEGGKWRTVAVDKVLKEEYQAKGIAVVASDQMALIPEGRTAAEVMGEVRQFAISSGAGR